MQASVERHKKIKYELDLIGISFSQIARELKVSHTMVLHVSNGRLKSERIQKMIAEKLGRKPEDIWSDSYQLVKRHDKAEMLIHKVLENKEI